jgi:hypothetical protein
MCLIPASFKSGGVRRVYVCASVQSNQTNILFDVGDLLTQRGRHNRHWPATIASANHRFVTETR